MIKYYSFLIKYDSSSSKIDDMKNELNIFRVKLKS